MNSYKNALCEQAGNLIFATLSSFDDSKVTSYLILEALTRDITPVFYYDEAEKLVNSIPALELVQACTTLTSNGFFAKPMDNSELVNSLILEIAVQANERLLENEIDDEHIVDIEKTLAKISTGELSIEKIANKLWEKWTS